MKRYFFTTLIALSVLMTPALLSSQDEHHPDSGDQTGQAADQQDASGDDTYVLGSGRGTPQQGMMGSGGGMMGMMGGGMMGPGMMGSGGGMMNMMSPGMMGMMGMMGGPEMMGRDPLQTLRQRLELSEDQVSRLRQLRLDHVRASAPAQANLQIAHVELQTILASQRVNMQQVEQKVREIQQVQGDLMLAGIRSFQQLKGILNQEQLEQLQGMMGPGMMEDGGGMMGGSGMMGPGRSGPGRGPGPRWNNGDDDDDD